MCWQSASIILCKVAGDAATAPPVCIAVDPRYRQHKAADLEHQVSAPRISGLSALASTKLPGSALVADGGFPQTNGTIGIGRRVRFHPRGARLLLMIDFVAMWLHGASVAW